MWCVLRWAHSNIHEHPEIRFVVLANWRPDKLRPCTRKECTTAWNWWSHRPTFGSGTICSRARKVCPFVRTVPVCRQCERRRRHLLRLFVQCIVRMKKVMQYAVIFPQSDSSYLWSHGVMQCNFSQEIASCLYFVSFGNWEFYSEMWHRLFIFCS